MHNNEKGTKADGKGGWEIEWGEGTALLLSPGGS